MIALDGTCSVELAGTCTVELAGTCTVEVAGMWSVEVASKCSVGVASKCFVEVASKCSVELASKCSVEVAGACTVVGTCTVAGTCSVEVAVERSLVQDLPDSSLPAVPLCTYGTSSNFNTDWFSGCGDYRDGSSYLLASWPPPAVLSICEGCVGRWCRSNPPGEGCLHDMMESSRIGDICSWRRRYLHTRFRRRLNVVTCDIHPRWLSFLYSYSHSKLVLPSLGFSILKHHETPSKTPTISHTRYCRRDMSPLRHAPPLRVDTPPPKIVPLCPTWTHASVASNWPFLRTHHFSWTAILCYQHLEPMETVEDHYRWTRHMYLDLTEKRYPTSCTAIRKRQIKDGERAEKFRIDQNWPSLCYQQHFVWVLCRVL